MGWFDGDPVNLSPLTRKELGAEIIALSGSAEKVFTCANEALHPAAIRRHLSWRQWY